MAQRPSSQYLWLTGLRDLQFRRRRFALAVLGTALVLSLTVLISGLQQSFTDEVDRTLDALGGDAYVVSDGAAGPFTAISQLNEDQIDAVTVTPGVEEAAPLVTIRESVGQSDPVDVFVIGHQPGQLGSPAVSKGRPVAATGEVVVNNTLDETIGDTLPLAGEEFEVVGEVDGLSVFAGTPIVFMTAQDVQRIVFGGLPVATSVATVGVPDPAPAGTSVFTRAGARKDLLRSLESYLGAIDVFEKHCCVRGSRRVGETPAMRRSRSCPPVDMGRSAFSGFRFPSEVIILAVRWYLRYGLSYRDLEELLAERGVEVDHVTLFRWVQRFTPLLVEAARPCRHAVSGRWFVDETYVKVSGVWRHVYRAVDERGQVIDVYVSARRDIAAARRFFTAAITAHGTPDEVVTDLAQALETVTEEVAPRAFHNTEQYANNRVECDHGRLKARLRPMRGLKTDRTARAVISGHAFMQNIRRGHYELGVEADSRLRVREAFNELTVAI